MPHSARQPKKSTATPSHKRAYARIHARHEGHYVKIIKADPAVRVRLKGNWHNDIAHLLPDDDPHARLKQLPGGNSAVVRLVGTDLRSIRIDLT